MVYLSFFLFPKTFNLCSLEFISLICILATSSALNPEQYASNNQHLCFRFCSSLKILINKSLSMVVGIFLTIFVCGNNLLLNYLLKLTK